MPRVTDIDMSPNLHPRLQSQRAPLSLPLSCGRTRATALAAPVVVGTMLSAAARAPAQVAVARIQQPLSIGQLIVSVYYNSEKGMV